MSASKKDLPQLKPPGPDSLIDGVTCYHIVPAVQDTLNLGVNVPDSGFGAYPVTVSPISIIAWRFYPKNTAFAIVAEIQGKRYHWQVTEPPNNRILCVETTDSISAILNDHKNLFTYVGAIEPYYFKPLLLPNKYVEFLSSSSLYMGLNDNPDLGTGFNLNSPDIQPILPPQPKTPSSDTKTLGVLSVVALVAVLIGIIAYKKLQNE